LHPPRIEYLAGLCVSESPWSLSIPFLLAH
jgi:hypothetical protein